MAEGRWVLLVASEVGRTDSVSDRAMERLVDAIGEEGYEVVRTSTPEDGLSLVTSDPSYSAILLDWDLEGDNQFDERAAMQILRSVRRRNKKVPIFLIADRTLVSELPLEVVKQVHEYIHLFGDTPAFIANRVDFAVERYHEQLLPPYFRELKKYTDQGAYSWDAPGHMGGVAFLKHPVGMEFHKFFGENILRSDLGISTARSAPGSTTSAPRATPSATPPASSAPTGPSTSSAPAPPTRSSATASSPRTTSSSPTPTATSPSATPSPSPAPAPSTSSPPATATA